MDSSLRRGDVSVERCESAVHPRYLSRSARIQTWPLCQVVADTPTRQRNADVSSRAVRRRRSGAPRALGQQPPPRCSAGSLAVHGDHWRAVPRRARSAGRSQASDPPRGRGPQPAVRPGRVASASACGDYSTGQGKSNLHILLYPCAICEDPGPAGWHSGEIVPFTTVHVRDVVVVIRGWRLGEGVVRDVRTLRCRCYNGAVSETTALLVIVVVTAVGFDFTNGFHDTANAMATTIATRALPPRIAVGIAATLNFVGAFLSISVAATIANGHRQPGRRHARDRVRGPRRRDPVERADVVPVDPVVLVARVDRRHRRLGARCRRLERCRLDRRHLQGRRAGTARADRRRRRGADRDAHLVPVDRADATRPVAARLSRGQIGSSSLVALAHGTNDAQKTMGVIVLALVAAGRLGPDAGVPMWVKIVCAAAIAAGTFSGGWRVIRTLGTTRDRSRAVAGLLGRDRVERHDPVVVVLRLSAVDHAGDRGRDHGNRDSAAAARSSTGASSDAWSSRGG